MIITDSPFSIAQVYVYRPRYLFRSAWAVFDVLALLLMTVGLWVSALNFVVILRLFHLMRAYTDGHRIHAILFTSMRPASSMCSAGLFWVTVLLTFSFMGIELYSGRFNDCLRCSSDENGQYSRMDCRIVSNASQFCNQSTCEAAPYFYNASNPSNGTYQIWAQPATTFDNLYQASLAFLRVTMNADWALVTLCSCPNEEVQVEVEIKIE